jgi:hypothetical protein
MKYTRLFIFACSLCLSSWSALAINRCIDANGKLAFQDRPCPVSSTSTTVKPTTSNIATTTKNGVQLKEIDIGSNNTFTVGLPQDWQVTVQPAEADGTITLKAVPEQGDALLLLMSFLSKRQSVAMDATVLDKVMQGIHEEHSANPNERQLASIPIKPLLSKSIGHLLTYVDKALLADANRLSTEFSHLTTGALLVEGMTVSVSILNNKPSGENYAKALLALATIVYKEKL